MSKELLAVTTVTETASNVNVFMYISILEAVAIIVLGVLLLVEKQKHSKKNELKQKLKNSEDTDFGDVFQSAFHAKEVYDELKVRCHPDRFVSSEEKQNIANELFQEITKNKNNYKKLVELKERATKELNIVFNN